MYGEAHVRTGTYVDIDLQLVVVLMQHLVVVLCKGIFQG